MSTRDAGEQASGSRAIVGFVLKLALFFACITGVSTPAAAQAPAIVDPAAHAFLPTTRGTGIPFGYPSRPFVRLQQIHDGVVGQPRTFTRIAIRRVPGDPIPAAAFDATLTLRLSTATTSAATMSDSFAANVGPDVREVLPLRTVTFPGTPPTDGTTEPAPFDYVIPFAFPFAFSGAGPLCIELRIEAHTNQRTDLRFALASEDPQPRIARVSDGCGGLDLAVAYDPTTALASHVVTGSIPGSPLLLAFGFSALLTAPIDLAPFGAAPGCAFHVPTAAPIVVAAATAGYRQSFSLDLNLSSAPAGLAYVTQALSPLVPRAQPGPTHPLIASGARLVTAGGIARRAGRLWTEDSAATTGQLQPVFATVIELR